MAKPARVPYNSPLQDPEVFKGVSNVSNVPSGYFAPGKFPPTQLCQYCEHTQAHDPTQQSRIAIGTVNGLRVCQYHLDLFEFDPSAATGTLPSP